jgi:iron-sulfur cluster assembly protein|tara:strand:- start:957 stop:1283 length:327 start_codon:yes stop_codon:yes gene_type:complete
MVEVTDDAMIALIERNVEKIRLGVKEAGCVGYEYIFAEDILRPGDEVFDYGRFSFLVDKMSQPFLQDVTVDYVREGLNEFFKLLNPNETTSCGCGVSVQFNEDIISKS